MTDTKGIEALRAEVERLRAALEHAAAFIQVNHGTRREALLTIQAALAKEET